MNDRPDLAGLREDLDLPPTRVAEGAWDRGRRRVRRRRVAGGAAVVALVAAVLVPTLGSGGVLRGVDPAAPTPSRTGDPGGAPPALDDSTYDRVLGEAVLPPPAPVTRLADDPLDQAAAVVEQDGDALVLGDDGTYRRIEVGLEARGPDGRGPVRASSLDPTASLVALLGDGVLLVADLPAGTTTSTPLPGSLASENPEVLELAWRDQTRVAVYGSQTSTLVDVEQQTTRPFDLRSPAAFGEGGPVSWTSSLLLVDGEPLDTRVRAVGTGLGPTPPLRGDGYAVATALVDDPDAEDRDGVGTPLVNGVAVLDLDTGDLRSFLPVDTGRAGAVYRTVPLALDGDAVIVGVPVPTDGAGPATLVLRWDPAAATLDGVTVLPAGGVAWGRGWQDPGGAG